MTRHRAALAALMTILGAASSDAAGATSARHLIYLHGRIVQEQQSPRPQHPEFGYYELEKILAAFRQRGFVVSGEMRPKANSVSQSADHVVEQVRHLLQSGVAAERVTVVGASMGAGIAMLASARLQEPKLRFAVLGACLDENVRGLRAEEGKAPSGNLLAIRESSDTFTARCSAWKDDPKAAPSLHAREILLNTGLSHGFLYRPLPEWLNPVVDWAQAR